MQSFYLINCARGLVLPGLVSLGINLDRADLRTMDISGNSVVFLLK
jgi:hypothetical protein